ncbi:protein SPMIP1 [Anomaloglossus baeobatrachus]|uniref:protein SPMIP1 n=1 Tax=Anomaloglossus baeobatrachus TaxID=238106 RepID=UPI003F507A52
MARELNLTTQKQEFIKESNLKEIHTRMNWWRQYRQGVQAGQHDRSKIKVKVNDHLKLPSITHPNLEAKIENKKEDLEPSNSGSDQMESSTIDSQMKPVSAEARSLLYHGTSKEGKGRYRYLKLRNSLGPEEKYYYPLATSWVYGWHVGNLVDNCPQFRRCRIVSDTFYRKNGIPTEPTYTDMAL